MCDSLQRAAEDAATPHHHAHVHRAGAVTMGGDTIEMGRRALGTIKLPAYVKLPYFRVTKVPTGANTHESPVDSIDDRDGARADDVRGRTLRRRTAGRACCRCK